MNLIAFSYEVHGIFDNLIKSTVDTQLNMVSWKINFKSFFKDYV